MSIWTDKPELVARLKSAWQKGDTATKIAGSLGNGITHSAVCGMVRRMGLSPHLSPDVIEKKRKAKADRQKAKTAELPPLSGADIMPINGKGLSMEALTSRTCRYPIGTPGADDFCFCGHPTDGRGVYCPAHRKICFVPIKPDAKLSKTDAAKIEGYSRLTGAQRIFG